MNPLRISIYAFVNFIQFTAKYTPTGIKYCHNSSSTKYLFLTYRDVGRPGAQLGTRCPKLGIRCPKWSLCAHFVQNFREIYAGCGAQLPLVPEVTFLSYKIIEKSNFRRKKS